MKKIFHHKMVKYILTGLIFLWSILIWAIDPILSALQLPEIREMVGLDHTSNPSLKPTPIAAQPGESLILIADFENRRGEGNENINAHDYVYEKLAKEIETQSLSKVRVERLYSTVTDKTVHEHSEQYHPTLVLWGWYDGFTLYPHVECMKPLEHHHSALERDRFIISEKGHIDISVIDDYTQEAMYLTFYTLALERYESGDYDTALAYVTKALEIVDTVEAKQLHARLQLHHATQTDTTPHYQTALEAYDNVIAAEPELAEAYNNRGIIHTEMDNTEQALADFTRAIELDNTIAEAYFNRGIVYADKGDFHHAIEDYTQAMAHGLDNAVVHNNRGWAHYKMGDIDHAIEDYTNAIERDSTFALPYRNRGFLLSDQQRYDEAAADFAQAIALDQNDATAYYGQGFAHYQMEQYHDAIDALTHAIELNPNYAEAYEGRAFAYHKTNQDELAEQDKKMYQQLMQKPVTDDERKPSPHRENNREHHHNDP